MKSKLVVLIFAILVVAAIGLVIQEKTAYIVEYPEIEDFPIETQADCIYLVNSSINYINATTVVCQAYYTSLYIRINASDIALDCNNSVFNGGPGAAGVNITFFNKVNITNCIMRNYGQGGFLMSSNYSNFTNNTLFGISLMSSSNNTFTNNNFSYGFYGIKLDSYSNNNTITNNTVNRNNQHGIYLVRSSYNTLENNTANNNLMRGIYLEQSSNYNTLKNNTANLNGMSEGIYLFDSSNNTLTNNTANNNDYGIRLGVMALNNTLTNNTANNNIRGINFVETSNANFIGNTANNNSEGIVIRLVGGTFANNTFNNNTNGIIFQSSLNNIISNNTVINNTNTGISLQQSSNNTLTNNTAQENAINDFVVSPTSNAHCNNIVETFTGSNNLPIKYFNSSVNLQNEELSELILCNADYSNINNITIDASQTKNNNGISLIRTDYTNITNANSSNNDQGISLMSSSNNTLINNTANNSQNGIYLYGSSNNTLTNNTLNSNSQNGIALSTSNNNTLINNTANSNNIYGIYLTSSNNIILANNTANNNGNKGISLDSSSNNTLTNNTANSNSQDGIRLSLSSNNILTNNIFNSNNYQGIYIQLSSNNTLTNNILNSNSQNGISLYSSNNNTLTNNTLNLNHEGINITASSNITLINNTLTNNVLAGITLTANSENNSIYNNYFSGNAPNAYDPNATSSNKWNTTKTLGANIVGGSYIGGNYWNDYIGTDTDGDWIGDTEVPYNSSNNIIFGGDYLPLVLGNLEIVRFELTPNETYVRKEFEISVLVNNSGNAKTTNNTLWFSLDGNDWMNSNGVIPDLLPGESYEFETTAFIEDINEHNVSVYLNSSVADFDESDNHASALIFLRTSPSGGASGPAPIVQPVTQPVSPTLTRESIATFPRFRISFLNCSLNDKTFNIPPEGATVVLQGSLDDKSQPTPGTAAVLLYPSNISANETKPMYISKIQCIEPEQYAIVHCNQSVIASYEVDVTADLSYLCINYEGTEITPESVTINLNEGGQWKPVTITNVLHNVEKSIICGNITGHTPYMVAGFVPKPEIVSAMEAIDALKSAIDGNCPTHEACTEAESLLKEAQTVYESCQYTNAEALANQGRALFVKTQPMMIFAVLGSIIAVGIASVFIYFKK